MIKTGSYDQSFVDQREDIKALKLLSVADKFFDWVNQPSTHQ